jgi:hypothetical protein
MEGASSPMYIFLTPRPHVAERHDTDIAVTTYLKGHIFTNLPNTFAWISYFPQDEMLYEGPCNTPWCRTLPTPYDVTPWRHEDRQLWPLPRFTKPLSRSWHYSQGGDNPCAAALMTQDAPLGFQTGCWRFSLRCFTYSFRGRNPIFLSSLEVQQFMWQNSDLTLANQQCVYEKYIWDD